MMKTIKLNEDLVATIDAGMITVRGVGTEEIRADKIIDMLEHYHHAEHFTLSLFLKHHGALGAFKKNYRSSSWKINMHDGIGVDKYLKTKAFNSDAIVDAFHWIETPEGDVFWSKLNRKWDEHSDFDLGIEWDIRFTTDSIRFGCQEVPIKTIEKLVDYLVFSK